MNILKSLKSKLGRFSALGPSPLQTMCILFVYHAYIDHDDDVTRTCFYVIGSCTMLLLHVRSLGMFIYTRHIMMHA